MIYTACEVVDGTAYVADEESWQRWRGATRATLKTNVPYPLFGPAQDRLDANLR